MQRAGLFPTFDLMNMYSRLHPRSGFYEILVGSYLDFYFCMPPCSVCHNGNLVGVESKFPSYHILKS